MAKTNELEIRESGKKTRQYDVTKVFLHFNHQPNYWPPHVAKIPALSTITTYWPTGRSVATIVISIDGFITLEYVVIHRKSR